MIDWNTLLSNRSAKSQIRKWSTGDISTREVTSQFTNSPCSGEFRKLVRNHGTTYARRLARKALRRRNVNV